MRPDEFRILYQDTDAGPYDGGASGSQTTFNNGRAVIAAANEVREQLLDLAADLLEANRADLELVDGTARVKGSQHRVGLDRGACVAGRRRRAAPRQGLRRAAADAGSRRGELRRPPRRRVLRGADVLHPRHPRQGRPRHRRGPGPRGCGLPRVGRRRQPDRRGRPDPRRRGDGHRAGAHRGRPARRRRPAAQPVPPRLQAPDRGRRPDIHVDFVDAPSPTGGPKGLKGIAEPPCVPTPGAIANAIAARGRRAGPRAADDARAGLGRHGIEERRRLTLGGRYSAPTELDDALTAAAAGHRPVAGGTDLVVGSRQGKWSCPRTSSRSTGSRSCAGSGDRGRAPARRDDQPRRPRRQRRDPRALDGARRCRGDRRLAGDAARRDARWQPDERLAGRRDQRCRCSASRPRSSSVRRPASRRVALADLFTGPGRTSLAPDELIVSVDVPGLPAPGSCYARLEFRRQMEIAVVGATAVVRLDGGVVRDARIAITALAPTVRRVPRPRPRSSALTAGRPRRPSRPPGGRGRDPDRGRPRLARLPHGDGGRCRPPAVTRRDRPGARRDRPDPGQRQPVRSRVTVRLRHAPGERDELRGRDRAAGPCCPSCATSWGSPAPRRAATTPSAARAWSSSTASR